MTPQHAQIHRRDLLRLAGFGGAAWMTGASTFLARAEEGAPRRDPSRSLILLWLAGGPSQLETFDPHPGTTIAGGTQTIQTRVPGVQLAEGFERLAERMDVVSIVRSLRSQEGDHERGVYYAKTGYRPLPAIVHPSLGAVVCHGLPKGGAEVPRHVSILPDSLPGWGGVLGPQYDAFQIGDPAGSLPDVTERVDQQRVARRLAGLSVAEEAFASGRGEQVAATSHQAMVAAARKMMTSEQLIAFDVSQEPEASRRRYGESAFGRGCLAARRLVEVGVRCVEVTLSGWDSHINNHEIHRDLVAKLDPAMAALLADLQERDLLSRTVVMCGGEFGRTPRLNRLAGRDHWPHNFAYAIAGGGLRGGQVIGQSDPEGNRPADEMKTHSLSDLHATALAALGIDPAEETYAPDGRLLKLSEGTPITGLV